MLRASLHNNLGEEERICLRIKLFSNKGRKQSVYFIFLFIVGEFHTAYCSQLKLILDIKLASFLETYLSNKKDIRTWKRDEYYKRVDFRVRWTSVKGEKERA